MNRSSGVAQVSSSDKESECTSYIMDLWAYHHHVRRDFSCEGTPTDNASGNSLNGTFRRECLNTKWFTSFNKAARQIEAWRQENQRVVLTERYRNWTPDEFSRPNAENQEIREGEHARELTLQLL